MKQGSSIGTITGAGEDDARSRRLRRIRWAFLLLAIVGVGWFARRIGLVANLVEVCLIIASLLVLVIGWTKWSDRRRQRRWRRDGILFEPQLPRPISSIPEEYEWQLPSHPLIRAPLAVALTALLYWVLVVHGMQLPGSWLVGTAVLTLVNLWVWREPLLLVFIVALAVLILALIRWVVQTLPVLGAIAALLMIAVVLFALWVKIRQRLSMGSAIE
ncbi:MAG: hypothetical protein RI928_436 [Pseudomonadota bacterium]|jgi:hypothetical protein